MSTQQAHTAPVGLLVGSVNRAADIWECDLCGCREGDADHVCARCGNRLRLHPAGSQDEVVLEVYADGSVKEIIGEGHLETNLRPGGRNWSVKTTGGE
jgi:hypothetical protein